MKILNILSLIVGCIALLSCTENITDKPVDLRCEYLINPIGLDVDKLRFTWRISDESHGISQTAYQIIIGTDPESVKIGKGNTWTSEKINSSSILAIYDGESLKSFTTYYWVIKYWNQNGDESLFSDVAEFSTGMMDISDWQGTWISDGRSIDYRSAPYFRKKFHIEKEIFSATIYLAAAGLYELYVNGEKEGGENRMLDPMFTRFDRRTLYTTTDITDQINEGENVIGILLGNGWYNLQSKAVWYFDKAPWRDRPKFCLDMHINYKDGTSEIITSGRDWKTTDSPLIYNSIYTGEYYDARLEIPDWCKAGFNDEKWDRATIAAAPSLNIVAQQLHPVSINEELKPASFRKINNQTYVYLFERNIAGISKLNIKGKRGTEISLKHGEVLYDDGRVNTEHIGKKRIQTDLPDPFGTDIYILKGEGEEVFQSRFNYKGFQFVEVTTSVPVELTQHDLSALVVHTGLPEIGSVSTSNEIINKIFRATNYSYLNNLHGYPTDCPHREKNGWTGDAHIAIETALYGYDGITLYEKWLNDHLDEQQPNGVLPNIIPTSGWGYHWANGTDWVSTIAIIPWQIYQFYGDTRLLENTYDGLKRYVDLLIRRSSPDGLINWALGDWSPIETRSNTELISSLYFYQDALILSKSAGLFGKTDDQKKYAEQAEKIKTAINNKFLDKTNGKYADGSQTEQSAPLVFGIVPEDIKPKVVEQLIKRIHASDDHMDVGLLGARTLFNALSENGHTELAFKILSQETYPSFGFWMMNGATTLYEHWRIEKDKIASLNHIMFGECAAWLYKAIGGIYPDPDHPGFKQFILKPSFIQSLDYAKAYHISPYGKINSEWKRVKDKIIWDISIPANSSAVIILPVGSKITESDAEIENHPFIKRISSDDRIYKYQVVSGNYRFEIESEGLKATV